MQELNEAEMFRTVLNEMLDELKQLHVSIKEMNKTVAVLHEKIDKFDQRLENLQVVAPPPDLQPLKEQLAEGVSTFNIQAKETMEGMQKVFTVQMQKITDTLAASPKPIVRRLSLFPENDYHNHYKYFIKGLFLATVGVCLVGALYALGSQWLQQRRAEAGPAQERSVSMPGSYQPPAPVPLPERHVRKVPKRHREADTTVTAGVDTGSK